jgi:hypothetical protein
VVARYRAEMAAARQRLLADARLPVA